MLTATASNAPLWYTTPEIVLGNLLLFTLFNITAPTANDGWKDCTAVSDDSVIYTLYDGKQNYVAKVNIASGAAELNVGNKNDKELVALMQSYVDAFMEQYK